MTSIDHGDPPSQPAYAGESFLGISLQPALLPCCCQAWQTRPPWSGEEGDPLCAVPDPQLEKPNGYELDRTYLNSFVIWMYSTPEQYGRGLLDNST